MRLTILGIGVLSCLFASMPTAEAAHVEIRADGSRLLIIVEGKTVAIVPGPIYLADGMIPVPPGPGPDPKPPVPPVDTLAAELKQLFDADGGADKRAALSKLQEVYKQGVECCDDKSLDTVGDVLTVLQGAAGGVAKDALSKLRSRLADELRTNLKDRSAKLDPELRAKLRELFRRIAALLLGLL